MKKRTTLLFACGLLIVAPVYASTIRHKSEGIFSGVLSNEKIKGKVMDKEGTPIANALVTELNDIYSNNMVQCDSTGYFEITVDTNSATLMVSAIGYLPRKLESDEFKEKDGLKICLDVNPDFTIEGVEVVAKRKVVTVTPTGLIYNMNDNPLKSEDALEALRFVPMMIVKEDLPSVVGKGTPVVYVNNRKLRLSGQSLTAYLKSLPAQNIETVEIITIQFVIIADRKFQSGIVQCGKLSLTLFGIGSHHSFIMNSVDAHKCFRELQPVNHRIRQATNKRT